MLKLRHSVGSAALLLLLVAGCGGGDGDADADADAECVRVPNGIAIEVSDAGTGKPMSCGARAVVTEGSYSEEVDHPVSSECVDTDPLEAAFGRGGTYTVTVSKPGFSDLVIEDVEVRGSKCDTRTTTVDAKLSPVPALRP